MDLYGPLQNFVAVFTDHGNKWQKRPCLRKRGSLLCWTCIRQSRRLNVYITSISITPLLRMWQEKQHQQKSLAVSNFKLTGENILSCLHPLWISVDPSHLQLPPNTSQRSHVVSTSNALPTAHDLFCSLAVWGEIGFRSATPKAPGPTGVFFVSHHCFRYSIL